MKEDNIIKKIETRLNDYLKLKYFTLYLVFASVIFTIMGQIGMGLVLMTTSFFYLILLNKSRITI